MTPRTRTLTNLLASATILLGALWWYTLAWRDEIRRNTPPPPTEHALSHCDDLGLIDLPPSRIRVRGDVYMTYPGGIHRHYRCDGTDIYVRETQVPA